MTSTTTCPVRQFTAGLLVLTLCVWAGDWGNCTAAELVTGEEHHGPFVDPVPARSERSAVYVEILGRSACFWALHVEIAALDNLALEGGGGYASAYGVKGLHADVGITYWAWSAGSSALVLDLALIVAGMDPPFTDHYCDPAESCERHLWWGAGLGVGIFYEFRRNILLRVGVTPTAWFYSESDWISTQFFEDAGYLWKLVALQVGWSF